MKNIFKVSLFAMGVVLSSNAMAATGTGHAQTELDNPLSIEGAPGQDVLFGTIAIDPAAGPQTVVLEHTNITCPATYVCSGSRWEGLMKITGAPSITVSVSLEGSTAILSDGTGQTLVFDPAFSPGAGGTPTSRTANTNAEGVAYVGVSGSIDFTGNEVAGTYSSSNAGGTGYSITVNY